MPPLKETGRIHQGGSFAPPPKLGPSAPLPSRRSDVCPEGRSGRRRTPSRAADAPSPAGDGGGDHNASRMLASGGAMMGNGCPVIHSNRSAVCFCGKLLDPEVPSRPAPSRPLCVPLGTALGARSRRIGSPTAQRTAYRRRAHVLRGIGHPSWDGTGGVARIKRRV